MGIAFSYSNRLRLGQAKDGLAFNPHRPTVTSPKFKEHEFGGGIIYDSGHVGWTSISNVDTCPNM